LEHRDQVTLADFLYGTDDLELGHFIVCAPLTTPSLTWRHADIVWAMDRSIGWAGQPERQQFFHSQDAG
ncbi:hypothetical protein, partial [Acidithiobacillus sp.]